jgi:hypothetical protein
VADDAPFRVSNVARANAALAALATRAIELGVRERLADCLRRIQEELRARPLDWGEPKYRLRGAGLVMCVGFHDRISVTYGVHEQNRLVFVQSFEAQPGHPLFVPPDA